MHRATQKSVDQHRIPFEAAGAQDDPVTSADGQLLTARGDPDADDLAALGNQFLGAGIGLRCDAGIQQSFE